MVEGCAELAERRRESDRFRLPTIHQSTCSVFPFCRRLPTSETRLVSEHTNVGKRLLLWVRPVAAVLIFLFAVAVALAAGLLTPYFLAARTANILLLTISAVVSFALLTCAGTKLAYLCWGTDKGRWAATLSGLLTIIFLGGLYVEVLRPSSSHFAGVVPYANTKYWQLL